MEEAFVSSLLAGMRGIAMLVRFPAGESQTKQQAVQPLDRWKQPGQDCGTGCFDDDIFKDP